MDDNVIQFHGEGNHPFPRPYPARQGTPDWLKQISAEVTDARGGTIGTVKKCPPFVEAMGAGYFVPLVADVSFRMEAGGLEFSCELPIVSTHPAEQFVGTPMEGRVIVKFINPWLVRTPPGYSCLFMNPMNRVEVPFHIFSGIVETDEFYQEVNFPAVCLLRAGSSAVLKKGTPIAQVFPFRREPWKSVIDRTEIDRRNSTDQQYAEPSMYRNNYWKRGEYR